MNIYKPQTAPLTGSRPIDSDQTGFYIASSDHELLGQVSRLIGKKGMLGVIDTAGRMQYLVDGRRGSPLAARRILDTTQRLLRDQLLDPDDLHPIRVMAVDEILHQWQLSSRLKGYRYLRKILVLAAGNDFVLRPVSKTLYPAVAEHFKVSYVQIERDIRYCLKNRPATYPPVSNTAAICAMSDQVANLVSLWSRQTKLPTVAEATMGSYIPMYES